MSSLHVTPIEKTLLCTYLVTFETLTLQNSFLPVFFALPFLLLHENDIFPRPQQVQSFPFWVEILHTQLLERCILNVYTPFPLLHEYDIFTLPLKMLKFSLFGWNSYITHTVGNHLY